jgi:hypothetical protein
LELVFLGFSFLAGLFGEEIPGPERIVIDLVNNQDVFGHQLNDSGVNAATLIKKAEVHVFGPFEKLIGPHRLGSVLALKNDFIKIVGIVSGNDGRFLLCKFPITSIQCLSAICCNLPINLPLANNCSVSNLVFGAASEEYRQGDEKDMSDNFSHKNYLSRLIAPQNAEKSSNMTIGRLEKSYVLNSVEIDLAKFSRPSLNPHSS